MSMNGKDLGDAIANKIISPDASTQAKADVKELWEEIGKIIVNHIKDNLVIQIPAQTVITQVTGQATGVANIDAITINVVG